MAAPRILTYFDVVNSLQDFADGYGRGVPKSAVRRSILDAYEEFVSEHNWSFLKVPHRVFLNAPYKTGTVAYDHTGGTYERQLTLTDGVFPDWAADAAVRISGVVSYVEARKSDTVVTLDANINPGADISSGTSYELYQRWYALPNGFAGMARPMEESASWQLGRNVRLEEILAWERFETTTGDTKYYAIGPAPDLYGTMALWIHPPTDADETCDFLYRRRPRDLRYTGHDAADYQGTVAMTAGSATVSGTETAFASGHVNSIIRRSADTNRPTGFEGTNPWIEERAIHAVADATTLTMDAVASTTASGKSYVITDPIDLDRVAHSAFLRACELRLARLRNFREQTQIERSYLDALRKAKANDGRAKQRRVAGRPMVFVSRLADATSRPTVD